jgi:hypothetical protein
MAVIDVLLSFNFDVVFRKANFKDDFGNNRQNAANCSLRFPFIVLFPYVAQEDCEKDRDGEGDDSRYRQLVSKAHKNMKICRKIIERTDK